MQKQALLCALLAPLIVGIVGIGASCQKRDEGDASRAPAGGPAKLAPSSPPQNAEELKAPLAKIDDVTITLGEFEERINRQSPYIRARYTSLEQKKEFLDSLVRFEILAKEAYKRGLDKDPEVVRTMKQVMIQKLMRDEFDAKVTAEVAAAKVAFKADGQPLKASMTRILEPLGLTYTPRGGMILVRKADPVPPAAPPEVKPAKPPKP